MNPGVPGLLAVLGVLGPAAVAAQSPTSSDEIPEGVRVDTRIEYYEVDGPALSDVARQLNGMRLEGPDGPLSQGLTRYGIDAEWNAQAAEGTCAVADLTVHVDIVITLPRWPALASRPQAEKDGWARIDHAIRQHEYEHRSLTIAAAGELRDELEGRRTVGCRALRQVVAGLMAIVGTRLRERYEELDRNSPPSIPIG